MRRLQPVIDLARQEGVVPVGAIATSFGCPFEGDVPVARVVEVAKRMADMGIETIKLGDTIGTAWPSRVRDLLRGLRQALRTGRWSCISTTRATCRSPMC